MKKLFVVVTTILTLSVNAQLIIQTGATVYVSANEKITLQNTDLVNNGILTAAPASRFVFSGNMNSGISGTQSTVFSELEITKTGTNKLILQRALDINAKIVFTSGLIDLNNNIINLGSSAFLENESENSRVTGSNGGYLSFITSLNAPASANPANLGAVISSSQNLAGVIIRRGHQSQVNGFGNGHSVFRYYDIVPTNNTGLNATFRFNYFDAELNGLDENGLQLWKSSNNTTWTIQGSTSRNTTTNYVEKTGIADFSRWTLSSSGNALPVTGLMLSGRWKNNAAYLDWTTLAEYNNDHFNIERKYPDENDFTRVGSKNSAYADGNSQSPTGYNYIDASVGSNRGPIQYRLKQIDRNGQFTYSNTIILRPAGPVVFIEKIFPTVAIKNSLYIQTGNMNLPDMQVQLYDMLGRLHLDLRLDYHSQWLLLPPLSTGIYKLVIRSGEWDYTENIMK